MDIGEEKEVVIVEPIEDPFRRETTTTPQRTPAPQPSPERTPEKVPEKVPA